MSVLQRAASELKGHTLTSERFTESRRSRDSYRNTCVDALNYRGIRRLSNQVTTLFRSICDRIKRNSLEEPFWTRGGEIGIQWDCGSGKVGSTRRKSKFRTQPLPVLTRKLSHDALLTPYCDVDSLRRT